MTSKSVSTDDPLLTPVDVAKYLGVPPATVYAWRYRGVGPRSIKVGRYLRWRRSDVDAWLDQRAAG